MSAETHTDGKWCSDLHCSRCYSADTWRKSELADALLVQKFYRHWIISIARAYRHALDDLPRDHMMKASYKTVLDKARELFDVDLERVRLTDEEWKIIEQWHAERKFQVKR